MSEISARLISELIMWKNRQNVFICEREHQHEREERRRYRRRKLRRRGTRRRKGRRRIRST
jgi:hypothetical protein